MPFRLTVISTKLQHCCDPYCMNFIAKLLPSQEAVSSGESVPQSQFSNVSFTHQRCKNPISSQMQCISFLQVFAFFYPKESLLGNNIVSFYLGIGKQRTNYIFQFKKYKYFLDEEYVIQYVIQVRFHFISTSGSDNEPSSSIFSLLSLSLVISLKTGISLALFYLTLEF